MPPYIYALIAALVFAIVHGMHFTVAPLPGGHTHVTTLVERPGARRDTHGLMAAWYRDDVRFAGIGY